ncbi:hypothetical protein RHMOL_Rhmol09G0171100 [Rhododendron molle]|uniref:Uncharacterized protein n=1 Tax=Rhododendron molle TaxID=49168 RepID=A0ACC0MEC1_RHOML|nr:hypothetical protein RHMOL_Rhmol09G0171100 [Rhododendron molle]
MGRCLDISKVQIAEARVPESCFSAADCGHLCGVSGDCVNGVCTCGKGVPGTYAVRRLEQQPPEYCTTDAQCRTPLHPSFRCVNGKCKCPKGAICLDQQIS